MGVPSGIRIDAKRLLKKHLVMLGLDDIMSIVESISMSSCIPRSFSSFMCALLKYRSRATDLSPLKYVAWNRTR
jgi:hypothetical protein